MDDAEVEPAIIDQRLRDDTDAAAVLPRVADRREHDLFVTGTVDGDAVRREAREDAKYGVEIDERAAQELDVVVGIARDFGIKPESGDAEVAGTVGDRDVD